MKIGSKGERDQKIDSVRREYSKIERERERKKKEY